jgi:hypothetical protein
LLKFKVSANQLLGSPTIGGGGSREDTSHYYDHHGCDYLVCSKTIIATKVVTKGMEKRVHKEAMTIGEVELHCCHHHALKIYALSLDHNSSTHFGSLGLSN